MTTIRLIALAGVLGMLPTPISAQTPDGQNPANEGVCDVLQGADIRIEVRDVDRYGRLVGRVVSNVLDSELTAGA